MTDEAGKGITLSDTLINLVSGLGTGKDKSANNSFTLRLVDPLTLSSMHRGDWVSRKAVDIIPFDMTREWRNWQGIDATDIELIEETERRLGMTGKTFAGLQRSRLYGGSALYIGLKKPGNIALELDPERVEKDGLAFVHVLSKDDLTVGPLIRDIANPRFGQPEWYGLASEGGNVRIHPSRIVRLIGAPRVDPIQMTNDGWGDSILQVVYDAVMGASASQAHVLAMMPEAKVDIIRVPNLSVSLATPAGTALLTQRFTLANTLKSMINAVLLESAGEDGKGGEDWSQKTLSFAQFPELLQQYMSVAAAACDIPATRFLSQSPGGMNSSGDADLRNYFDRIRAEQRELSSALTILDECIVRSSLGERPPEVHHRWSSLWQVSDKERAETGKIVAETTNTLKTTGLFPDEALKNVAANSLVELAVFPEFTSQIEEAEAAPEYALELAAKEAALRTPIAGAELAEKTAKAGPQPPKQIGDAEPRTLYIRRDVLNKADIVRWAEGQGFRDIVPDLHVTILYSRAPIDWFIAGDSWDTNLPLPAGGPRLVEEFDDGAKALLFASRQLKWRHEEFIELGASESHPDYQPHITISYSPIDLAKVEAYQGKILLGPEIFEEVKED